MVVLCGAEQHIMSQRNATEYIFNTNKLTGVVKCSFVSERKAKTWSESSFSAQAFLKGPLDLSYGALDLTNRVESEKDEGQSDRSDECPSPGSAQSILHCARPESLQPSAARTQRGTFISGPDRTQLYV